LFLGFLLVLAGYQAKAQTEIDLKVEELLAKMTLHEKIGQMNQLSDGLRPVSFL
jgi:hypothetical protein